MRYSLFFLIFVAPKIVCFFQLQAHAATSGPLVKHLTSLVKWTRSSPKTPHLAEGYVIQFEEGYLVETVVEGNELGVVPYSIRVSHDGDLYAVDALNSNIVRITPPLSHYSRARLVAGSFQGHPGHVDGKPSDARFNHPKGVTVDDKGNVYVADMSNLAIRKIGEADLLMVAGAIIIGYVSCMLQQGFGSTFFSKMQDHDETELEKQSTTSKDTPTPIDVTVKDEQEPGWPSFSQLGWDVSKFALESLGSIFIPLRSKGKTSRRNLTPLKYKLIMPEDEALLPSSQKQRISAPVSETRHAPIPVERFTEPKPVKVRSSSLKDPSLSSKHRSSRRQEYAEFYGSGEVPPQQQVRSKSQKERTKHMQREKSGESSFQEQKPSAEVKATSYESAKYDPYNFRNKYGDNYRYE